MAVAMSMSGSVVQEDTPSFVSGFLVVQIVWNEMSIGLSFLFCHLIFGLPEKGNRLSESRQPGIEKFLDVDPSCGAFFFPFPSLGGSGEAQQVVEMVVSKGLGLGVRLQVRQRWKYRRRVGLFVCWSNMADMQGSDAR